MLRSLSGGTEQTPVTLFWTRHPRGVWSVPNLPNATKPVGEIFPNIGQSGSDQKFQELPAYCLRESAKSLPAQ